MSFLGWSNLQGWQRRCRSRPWHRPAAALLEWVEDGPGVKTCIYIALERSLGNEKWWINMLVFLIPLDFVGHLGVRTVVVTCFDPDPYVLFPDSNSESPWAESSQGPGMDLLCIELLDPTSSSGPAGPEFHLLKKLQWRWKYHGCFWSDPKNEKIVIESWNRIAVSCLGRSR